MEQHVPNRYAPILESIGTLPQPSFRSTVGLRVLLLKAEV